MVRSLEPGRLQPAGTSPENLNELDVPVALELSEITKRFGALVANDGISLDVRRGEIVALLGENGAGKTTLMNILFGHYVADTGTVRVATDEGVLHELTPGAPSAALQAGVGMVHQHFTLAENLSALENIILGTESLWRWQTGWRAAREKLEQLMGHSGLQVDLDARVSRLSVGEKQRVEILKALYRNARVLVLDEPTAVLTPQEAQTLFATLKALAAEGLAIILITHKLAEVLAVSHRVAVLRGGAKVGDMPISQCDRRQLAELMVGKSVEMASRTPGEPGEVLLELANLSAGSGRDAVFGVNLSLKAGEILGIAGVSGNGQSMLARLISGLEVPREGALRLRSKEIGGKGAAHAIELGIARIPEDRHRDGVVGAMSVAENLVIENIREKRFHRFGFVNFAAVSERAEEAIAAYDIRCPGPKATARLLSGGNIQKIVLARTLDVGPVVVLAAQPTRGLDVGATGEVHRRLLAARARGVGVILISEDLDELMQLSDRIAVIHAGRLSAADPTEALDRATLGLRMAGHDGEQAA